MTCVPFSGRPGSSGQLPLGVIPPNWGTDGWQRMDSTSRSDLPSKIVMRDNTEGFNQRMDFALRDGNVEFGTRRGRKVVNVNPVETPVEA